MSTIKQEPWQPSGFTFKVVAWIIAIAIVVGLYQMILETKIRDVDAAVTLLATHTDIVANYQPSPERAKFLQHIKRISDGRYITRRDIIQAEKLFKAARKTDESIEAKNKIKQLGQSVDKAL